MHSKIENGIKSLIEYNPAARRIQTKPSGSMTVNVVKMRQMCSVWSYPHHRPHTDRRKRPPWLCWLAVGCWSER